MWFFFYGLDVTIQTFLMDYKELNLEMFVENVPNFLD